MTNDKKALVALMDLVLAIADYVTTPPGHRSNAIDRVRAERREVEGWRETLALGNCGRLEAVRTARRMQQIAADGQEAKAAVEATVRRWEAYAEKQRQEPVRKGQEMGKLGLRPSRWQLMQELRDMNGEPVDPIEADDSRVTDGHQCCGGKPDCGCRSVGG